MSHTDRDGIQSLMHLQFVSLIHRDMADDPAPADPRRMVCECCGGKVPHLMVTSICPPCDALIGFEDQIEAGTPVDAEDTASIKYLLTLVKSHGGKFVPSV